MPAKNTVKIYVENGYYHIYNRGIDNKEIFKDEQDCSTFLYYLKLYLSPPDILIKEFMFLPKIIYKITNLNLHKDIYLLSFALMPNHFHLEVKQFTKDAIQNLTRRILTSYAGYFNNKYKRRGTLFESVYKAVIVETEEQLLYLSAYIHRNPITLINPKVNFAEFSSYPYYLQKKHAAWLNTSEILSYFFSSIKTKKNDILSYQSFVENSNTNSMELIQDFILETD